jgi:murein DD-endopeptidase MepM/ murein hydrolase activator NlpD
VVVSKYGWRRRPPLFKKEWHPGIDIRNVDKKTGMIYPVYATENARVSAYGQGRRYGENFIELYGLETGMRLLYCHNSWHGINVGSNVIAGEPIGFSDNSGGVLIHLHFGVFNEGVELDPIPEYFDKYEIEWVKV